MLYIHIYIYTYVCVYIYIYIYITCIRIHVHVHITHIIQQPEGVCLFHHTDKGCKNGMRCKFCHGDHEKPEPSSPKRDPILRPVVFAAEEGQGRHKSLTSPSTRGLHSRTADDCSIGGRCGSLCHDSQRQCPRRTGGDSRCCSVRVTLRGVRRQRRGGGRFGPRQTRGLLVRSGHTTTNIYMYDICIYTYMHIYICIQTIQYVILP